jgi:hypothetical protein
MKRYQFLIISVLCLLASDVGGQKSADKLKIQNVMNAFCVSVMEGKTLTADGKKEMSALAINNNVSTSFPINLTDHCSVESISIVGNKATAYIDYTPQGFINEELVYTWQQWMELKGEYALEKEADGEWKLDLVHLIPFSSIDGAIQFLSSVDASGENAKKKLNAKRSAEVLKKYQARLKAK